jgi:hypothetical protein
MQSERLSDLATKCRILKFYGWWTFVVFFFHFRNERIKDKNCQKESGVVALAPEYQDLPAMESGRLSLDRQGHYLAQILI